jgi:DNA-binding transcriptional LysR family regulator
MSDIENRLLRYFVAVAEEQHFSRAAQRLGISPPTLTHQIKKLEGQLNTKLFKRRGNTHFEITEVGMRLLNAAKPILQQAEELKFIARRTARGEIGSIKVGYLATVMCAGVMQKLLVAFQEKNPAVEISLHRLVPRDQIASIIRMDLDVGFTRNHSKFPPGLTGFEISRAPLMLALPSKHPLAQQRKIGPADLKNEVFINTAPELEIGFWGHVDAIARAGQFTPQVVKRDNDILTTLTYISMGYGIGVVPQSMSKINVPNITYREIASDPFPTSSIAFVYRDNNPSPSCALLTQYLRRYVSSTLKAVRE